MTVETRVEALSDQIMDLTSEEADELLDYSVRGYVGGLAVMMENVPDEVIKEYFAESVHNSWDGWEPEQLMGIMPLLRDILLYHKNS